MELGEEGGAAEGLDDDEEDEDDESFAGSAAYVGRMCCCFFLFPTRMGNCVLIFFPPFSHQPAEGATTIVIWSRKSAKESARWGVISLVFAMLHPRHLN